MQPVSNQYNITDKIIEANHQLYSDDDPVKQSQPKVRFRDHKLVDYEPEKEDETMDKKVSSKVIETQDEEVSDDGYIDEETFDETKSIEETVEIEDVCEQIQDLDERESNEKESSVNETYSKDDFNEEEEEERSLSDDTKADQSEATVIAANKSEKPQHKPPIRTKNSKVVPIDDKSSLAGEQRERKMCCHFKESDEYKQSLPKYNGFNSNYGLSKEEIARREHVRLRQHRYKELKSLQQVEQKEMEATLNEEAFAKWYV